MSDSRTREELVAEALRLLDLATATPVAPASEEPDGYSAEAVDVLRQMERRERSALPVDAPLYPSEDGPGAGRIFEVTVRVMVGSERSTVIVARGRDDPFVLREVREHGRELDGLGQAVEAALREALMK